MGDGKERGVLILHLKCCPLGWSIAGFLVSFPLGPLNILKGSHFGPCLLESYTYSEALFGKLIGMLINLLVPLSFWGGGGALGSHDLPTRSGKDVWLGLRDRCA